MVARKPQKLDSYLLSLGGRLEMLGELLISVERSPTGRETIGLFVEELGILLRSEGQRVVEAQNSLCHDCATLEIKEVFQTAKRKSA